VKQDGVVRVVQTCCWVGVSWRSYYFRRKETKFKISDHL